MVIQEYGTGIVLDILQQLNDWSGWILFRIRFYVRLFPYDWLIVIDHKSVWIFYQKLIIEHRPRWIFYIILWGRFNTLYPVLQIWIRLLMEIVRFDLKNFWYLLGIDASLCIEIDLFELINFLDFKLWFQSFKRYWVFGRSEVWNIFYKEWVVVGFTDFLFIHFMLWVKYLWRLIRKRGWISW